MPVPSAPATGEMHDFELDDDFWSGALAALREEYPAARLRERWPACAQLVEELLADAGRERLLVGFRLATHGRNPRLFAILTGAILARSGVPTIVLDLGPDTRWLEQLLGADYKEGFVDHLRFGLPLVQCIRGTGLDGLSAMSGGAWFLAGSPLDDAPGFRAGLEELRRLYRAVIVTVPPPLEAADRTGIAALCGALVTVEEGGTDATLAGSERAVVRLKGNTDAARDLAHLTHRFFGPLPVLFGATPAPHRNRSSSAGKAPLARGPIPTPVAGATPQSPGPAPLRRKATTPRDARHAAAPAQTAGDEDLLFLQGFETPRPGHTPSASRAAEEHPPDSKVEERGVVTKRTRRRARFRPRKGLIAAAMMLGTIVIVAIGSREAAIDAFRDLVRETDRSYPELEGGETIALDPLPGSGTEPLPADTVAGLPIGEAATDSILLADTTTLEGSIPPGSTPTGRVAPFSVHVGSYQSVGSALRVAAGVEAMGYPTTLAPVSIPDRGQWFRVYAGSFADSIQAQDARERLQSTDVVDEGVVRSAPWTFEIGTYPSLEAARAEAAALREKGIVAYAVGREPVRLYTGAYQSRGEAELLAQTLESVLDSGSPRLIMREE